MHDKMELIILGAGGAAAEAALVATRMRDPGWRLLGFADDKIQSGTIVVGYPVLGSINSVLGARTGSPKCMFHIGIGSNDSRGMLALLGEQLGLVFATLVDPSAVIADSAILGDGSYVGPHAFIGPYARLGRHVLVNVHASVGHHAEIGDFSQLCPGARVSGKCRAGSHSFVGSNGVVAPGVVLGERAIVGASSLAVRDVPDNVTAVGVPAKVLAAPPRAP